MRKLLLLVCSLLFSVAPFCSAQPLLLYGELGGGGGTHNGVKAALNGVINNKHIVTVNYSYYQKTAANTPSNFVPGFTVLGDGMPKTGLGMVTLCYGRMMNMPSPYVRLALKGGLALGTVEYPQNFKYKTPSNGMLSFSQENYVFDYVVERNIGLVLHPSVEFPLTRHFGFNIGLHSNINKRSSVFALEGGILFGKVRGRKNIPIP